MRLPVHNKLPAGSLGVYYRDGMPCNMWGNENGADDETITCLTSLQLVTYPASATAQSAEFASADCVTGLNEIGQISVSNISGDPQDVERIVALKADEQGASWYRIITMYEDQQPDNWRVQAILYA